MTSITMISFLAVTFLAISCVNGASLPSYEKVNMELYYATHCGPCRHFMHDQLVPTYLALKDIMNLTLVPSGGVEMTMHRNGTWDFECMHGPEECEAMMFHACTLSKWKKYDVKNDTQLLLLLACTEQQMSNKMTPRKSMELCLEKFDYPLYSEILYCQENLQGQQALAHFQIIEGRIAQNKWNPDGMHYIPYVVVNGEHQKIVRRAMVDLKGVICDEYKGPKPKACTTKFVGKEYDVSEMTHEILE